MTDPGAPQEVPPGAPGKPTEPPQESPPGSPRPEVPPPLNNPGPASPPQELPGRGPQEMPSRGPAGPSVPNPATDDGGFDDLPGSEPDVTPPITEPPPI